MVWWRSTTAGLPWVSPLNPRPLAAFVVLPFRLFNHRRETVCDGQTLTAFIDGNSAYVAQITLYGYIKTRAGLKYFRLFDDDAFVKSVNIAKWNIYAACVGDLSVFCAAHIYRHGGDDGQRLTDFMNTCVNEVFVAHAAPVDAGEEYSRLCGEVQQRVQSTPWLRDVADDETAFSRSPAALVHWAPVANNHKKYDVEVVENSIAFKWKEVRDNFRRAADLPALQAVIKG